jgi:glutathione S-transferase
VRIALAEKGLAYDPIEVDWNRHDRYLPHHPDVVAISPKGLEYLEDRYPAPALMPREPAARARCRLLELEACPPRPAWGCRARRRSPPSPPGWNAWSPVPAAAEEMAAMSRRSSGHGQLTAPAIGTDPDARPASHSRRRPGVLSSAQRFP